MKKAKRNKYLRNFLGRIMAYLGWDAGVKNDPARGNLGFYWGGIQSANEANDVESREEILRRAHHFERNNAIVNRLVDVFEVYTVGAGGMPILPESSDENWNTARKQLWDLWCKNPDLASLQSFGTIQSLAARRWFVDGEVFILKTRSDSPPFRARIQLIESCRIKTPHSLARRRDIIDGVQVDAKGRPVAYYVFETNPEGREDYKAYSAERIRHIHEPMRPGQYRSFSLLASVLNDIQDLDELCKLAMEKAKEAAEIKNVFKTNSGEVPTSEEIRRARFDISTETVGGTDQTKQRMQNIRQVLGSKTIALEANEDVSQLKAESPNQIEQAHWDIIASRICAGVGISKLLLFPNSMQGTVVRADLDVANTFFRARSAVLADAFLDIYEYVTLDESLIEPSIARLPKDWRKANIRPPRAVNVDVGRNSAAMIAELEAGATDYELIYSPQGFDWRERITARLVQEAFIDRESKRLGLTPDRVRKSIGEGLRAQMEAEDKARAEEDKATA